MPFADLILKTKLYIPPKSSMLVERQRVLSILEQGINHSVTLVSAPAGFGKTTLLSEWLSSEAGKAYLHAWLSLDPEDNDSARFLMYLSTSLDSLQEGISGSVLPLLQMHQPPSTDIILTSLINELTDTLQTPFVLVLDDYHVITSPAVHELLLFLIEHMPPQMRLVILTREDPPLPLAGLRARRQLAEIRAADLRFSHEESTAFLNQIMGLDLAANEIQTLEVRTEGWIAGLQMAALSMRGHDDKSSFIHTFASSHRFIFDYLIEVVLEGLTPEIQDFLMKTSILDRMCAPLCDVITKINDSQSILLQLEQMNLFIIPLDDQRRWYRYHHLFIDLLRQQLRIEHGSIISELHQRACQWHQDNDLIGGAIHHALIGRDIEKVAALAEKLVFGSIEHHELLDLSNWIGNLPSEVMEKKPWLSVAFSWILLRMNQFDQIDSHLRNAERSMAELPTTEDHSAHIQSHIAAIRAHLAKAKGDIYQVTSMARQSLDLLPEKEVRLRGMIYSLLGTSLQRNGKFEEAIQAYTDGIAFSRVAGDLLTTIEIFGDLTGYFLERGQLHEAFSACQDAFDYIDTCFQKGGRIPLGAAYIYLRLSTILRHWNKLEESLWHAQKSVEITEQWGFKYRLAHTNLAIALHAVGQIDDAMRVMQQAETIAAEESEFWTTDVRAIRALLWLDEGNLEAASRWMQESGVTADDEVHFHQQRLYLILAQVLLARGIQGDSKEFEKALQVLFQLETLYNASNAKAYLLQVTIFQALTYQAQGEMEKALSSINQALSIGEEGGFIRVFIREGAPMKKLLEQAANKGISPVYSQKLLQAFGDETKEAALMETPSKYIVDPLTQREVEILHLLDTDLPISDIADKLVLSVETVRTHIKHIYRKLGVHSRYEAKTKAEELNLF